MISVISDKSRKRFVQSQYSFIENNKSNHLQSATYAYHDENYLSISKCSHI